MDKIEGLRNMTDAKFKKAFDDMIKRLKNMEMEFQSEIIRIDASEDIDTLDGSINNIN